jgi:hypothetical protein
MKQYTEEQIVKAIDTIICDGGFVAVKVLECLAMIYKDEDQS